MHSEERIAQMLPEPADGTILVVEVDYADNFERRAIWRDDEAAKEFGGQEDERWFESDSDDYPMGFYERVKYASRVWVVSSSPPVVLEG